LPFDAASVPEAVVLKSDRMRLEIAWGDGNAAEVSAPRLRAACRCAWCTRERIDGTFAASFETITIDRLTAVGDYAINIAFSDGHARGIYPWAYLQKIVSADGRAAPPIASSAAASAQFHGGPCE
jgi:prepilin-type processing-associated H-X9-DG protein